ncbi:MAG TPA: MMPL family transporter [Myxococcota bacterium]|nr:MMPL family transporter [Myxococcota bacterium]HQK50848.1 MMPL family transporter [Myxococcota bacterium]
MLETVFERLARGVSRHPWWTLLAMAAVSALATWSTSRTPIFTSRRALLVPGSPEVQRFDRFLEHYGAASDLILALESPEGQEIPREEMEDFASLLAEHLREVPEVKTAEARVDVAFFLSHAWTSAPLEQLGQAESFIHSLVRFPDGVPRTMGEALDRAEAWFEDPPSLADKSIGLEEARRMLDSARFLLLEWLRWVESEATPRRISWEHLLKGQPEARDLIGGNGYYSTRDGTVLFVFVRPVNPSEDFRYLGPFYRGVRQKAEEVRSAWAAEGHRTPTVGLGGNPAIVYEEFMGLQRAVVWTVGTAAVLVLLVILFGLRSWRRAVVVFVPMGMGALWGTGLVLPVLGHMNMVTTAFTAILFGMGVDYGIFVSSRIFEEQQKGSLLAEAIATGTARSARAILLAAGASVAVFLSLATAEFRGFHDLGIVAALGIVTVVLATFLGLPALYRLLPPRTVPPLAPSGRSLLGTPEETGWRAWKMPNRVAVAMVTVFSLLGAAGFVLGLRLPFNYDVLEMLPKDSEAARLSRLMSERSDFQSEVTILLARDIAEARDQAAAAERQDTVAKVQTIAPLFPEDAEERARRTRRIGEAMEASEVARWVLDQARIELPADGAPRIAAILDRALDLVDDFQEAAFSAGHKDLVKDIEDLRGLIKRLATRLRTDPERATRANQAFLDRMLGDAQAVVRTMIAWKDARPLQVQDLPPDIAHRFFGTDGSVATYVYPKGSIYDLDFLDRMMADLKTITPEITGFPSTHQVMSRAAFHSFYRGTLLAFAVALIYLLVLLRRLTAFAVASLPLLVGEGLMLLLLAALGVQWNYANIIALPLLMALALDYGVWFAHRTDEMQDLGPWQVLQVAGGPILMAALTTLAGLGAISFADYRGVSTLGRNVTLGLFLCLGSALVIAPALVQVLSRVRRHR